MRPSIALIALSLIALSRPAEADVEVFKLDKPALQVGLFGYVQPRFTVPESDDRPIINLHPNPAFTVTRARLGTHVLMGTWAKMFVEVDFAKEIASSMDAYAVVSPIMHPVATLNITLGQFRVPFSRQNLTSSRAFQFPDPAYFVSPKFLIDRDIGAMIWSDLFRGRARVLVGIFNGNEPGRGQNLNFDPYFLYAGRIEISPLGPPLKFEGDVRPVGKRSRPIVTVGGSAMRHRLEDKHYLRSYVGADLAAWFAGASLYGEFYYHVDEPLQVTGPGGSGLVRQIGWNVQAGYLPPFPFVKEHIEIVARVQGIDPNMDVKQPANDNGARDLDQSNPTWGYIGYVFGANFFWDRAHDLKLQASYEIRNETKRCLEGQSGSGCTGYIKNNLFIIQATAGF